MEGEKKWHWRDREILKILLEHPGRVWDVAEVAAAKVDRVTLSGERLREDLYELWLLGAVEYQWDKPAPDRPRHPLDPRYVYRPQQRLQVYVTPDGEALIRNLIAEARPKGVIGTFLWEGAESAAAVRQAGKRRRAHQRALRRGAADWARPGSDSDSFTVSVLSDESDGRLPWLRRLWARRPY